MSRMEPRHTIMFDLPSLSLSFADLVLSDDVLLYYSLRVLQYLFPH